MGRTYSVSLARHMPRLNRTQVMVLGFLAAAWAALVALLAFAPDVFEQTLKQLPFADPHPFELVFVAALSVVLMIVAVGVVLRWRWTFWLMVAAFLAGLLRLPASVLELTGAISLHGPAWYAVLQGTIGVVQFTIAIAMLRGYRRGGPWGSF